MIATRYWSNGAWGAMAAGLAAIVWSSTATLDADAERGGTPEVREPTHAVIPYNGDSLVHVVVSHDAFRVNRTAATLAYDPNRAIVPAQPGPPKPALALVGLIAGADPTAVIEGLPGVEGSRAVRVGDLVGGLRVARIDRDQVVIKGMDTTWVLMVKEPWK